MRVLLYCVYFLFAGIVSANAQDITILVTSVQNQTPIEGVEIYSGARRLAVTNASGIATLPLDTMLPLEVTLWLPTGTSLSMNLLANHSSVAVGSDGNVTNLSEVVVTGAASVRTRTVDPTVSTIERNDISIYSSVDIVAGLNQVPGVLIFSGGLNTNRVTIRGVGARTPYGTNKIRGYLNGIPITNGTGETTLEVYDPEYLRQVEIVKGPKSPTYGSSLGGAILLETGPEDLHKKGIKNSFTAGSYGLLKNSLQSRYSEDGFSADVLYDHMTLDGYRQNSFYDRDAVLVNLSLALNDNNRISLLVNQLGYKAEIPSSIGKTAFEEDPSQAAANWLAAKGFENNRSTLAGLSLKHVFGEHLDNTTSIFYSYLDHYEPRPFNILDEFTHGYGIRSVFNGDVRLGGKRIAFEAGMEISGDTYAWQTLENLYQNNNGQGSLEGALLSDNKEYRERWNFFTTATVPLTAKWILGLGLSFQKNNYNFRDQFNTVDANTSARRNFDPILAPSVNLEYRLSQTQQLYLNISRGFAYPGLEETLNPEGVINHDIGPETGVNYEVGGDFRFFKNRVHFHAEAYYTDIRNLLVAQRVGEDQYIGRNAGRTSHKGLEVMMKYTSRPGKRVQVAPFVNIAYNHHRFSEFTDADQNYSGNDLTGVPDLTIASGITLKDRSGISLFMTHQYVGVIPLNDANTLSSDSYNVVNLKGSFSTHIFQNFDVELHAGVNNILDEKYASSVLINAVGFGSSEPRFYYPGLPVNYYGGIKMEYWF